MQLKIPDEYESQLIRLGDDLSDNIWKLARLTNVLLDVYVHDGQFTASQVYSAVAQYIGKPFGTVRDYAEVGRDFSQTTQDKYHDLKFDHFRRARRLSKKYNVEPETILKWASEQADTLGRPATVDSMTANFASDERSLQERLMILLESLLQELIDNGANKESIKTVKAMLADIIATIKEPHAFDPKKHFNDRTRKWGKK
jgi:hypothetical protein